MATRPDRRARWMRDLQDALLRARPDLAGKIDWDTASYLYTTGACAADAAQKMAK